MKIISISFIFLSLKITCQNIADYNSVYAKTYLETSQKDFKKALKTADSLYSISESPILKTKSLMLSATLYQQSGEFEKSITYAHQAEKIIENENDPVWKVRVYGLLATQYRLLRLFNKSRKYCKMGLAISKTIKNFEIANNTMGLMMQEMAYYDIEKQLYSQSLEKIRKAQYYFDQTKNKQVIFYATNEQLSGYNYYHLKDFEKSLQSYQRAFELSKNIPEHFLTGLIHNGLATVYIEKKDMINAKKHLDIAEKIAGHSKYLSLKKEVYETSENYYAVKHDLENLIAAKERRETLTKVISQKVQDVVDNSYSKIEEQNHEIQQTDLIKTIIIVIIFMLAAWGLLYNPLYRNKQKQKQNNETPIIKDSYIQQICNQEEKIQPHDSVQFEGNVKVAKSVKPVIMTTSTEQKILDKLKEFEESGLYISKNISLSYLAMYCQTNNKYLSHIINTYKDKDFNNYTNELKIKYIINKIQNNSQFRSYKIAILAEEAGFSSPNKFSTVFKKVTSISPSLFIKHLNEQKQLSE